MATRHISLHSSSQIKFFFQHLGLHRKHRPLRNINLPSLSFRAWNIRSFVSCHEMHPLFPAAEQYISSWASSSHLHSSLVEMTVNQLKASPSQLWVNDNWQLIAPWWILSCPTLIPSLIFSDHLSVVTRCIRCFLLLSNIFHGEHHPPNFTAP